MPAELNLRSRDYWKRLGWGLVIGLFSAIGAYIFIFIMNWGQSLFLPSLTNWTPFTGPWYMVVSYDCNWVGSWFNPSIYLCKTDGCF